MVLRVKLPRIGRQLWDLSLPTNRLAHLVRHLPRHPDVAPRGVHPLTNLFGMRNHVPDLAYSLNLDFNDVAILEELLAEEAHARRCSRHDNRPLAQRRSARQVADELADAPNHVVRVGVLLDRAVDLCREARFEGIPNLGRRGNGMAQGRKPVEGLGVTKLATRRLGQLKVSRRNVVRCGEAEDVVPGVLFGNVLGILGDYNGQLAFKVKHGARVGMRANHVIWPGKSIGGLGEDGRIRRNR